MVWAAIIRSNVWQREFWQKKEGQAWRRFGGGDRDRVAGALARHGKTGDWDIPIKRHGFYKLRHLTNRPHQQLALAIASPNSRSSTLTAFLMHFAQGSQTRQPPSATSAGHIGEVRQQKVDLQDSGTSAEGVRRRQRQRVASGHFWFAPLLTFSTNRRANRRKGRRLPDPCRPAVERLQGITRPVTERWRQRMEPDYSCPVAPFSCIVYPQSFLVGASVQH